MRFADAGWLHLFWLLPIVGLALVWAGRQRRDDLARWCRPELQRRMVPVVRDWSRSVQGWLRLAILALLILAIARPQIGSRVLTVKRSGIDVVIALDTSESMKAEDLKPDRITRARQEIQSLIDRLRGDRIGLVGFAGDAFVQCPVTLDYAAARMFLRFMDTDLIPVPGTAIARAIEVGTGAFDPAEEKFKALVLITDGEDHEGKLLEAARQAKDAGVRVFAVGIGTEQGEPIPIRDARGQVQDYKRDGNGEVILTQCNPAGLQTVCRETGGRYFDGQAGGLALDRLYSEIAALEEREMEGGLVTQYEDRFAYFGALALFLLLLDGLIGTRRRFNLRRLSASRAAGWLLLFGPGFAQALVRGAVLGLGSVCLLLPSAARADEGTSLYGDGKYAEARDYYEAFSAEHPEDSRADYNLGTTLHRTQEIEPALEALQRSLRSEDHALRSEALYNLGNTQVRAGDLQGAQDSYRLALRSNPDDLDAKFNLELVNRLLEEMPPDSSQQEDPSQDQQDQENENEEDSEQEQNEDSQNEDSENQDSEEQNQDQEQSEQEQNEEDSSQSEDSENSEEQSEQNQSEQSEEDSAPEEGQPEPMEGKISPEEARRILEALGQQENSLQAERMKARAPKVNVEKDW